MIQVYVLIRIQKMHKQRIADAGILKNIIDWHEPLGSVHTTIIISVLANDASLCFNRGVPRGLRSGRSPRAQG